MAKRAASIIIANIILDHASPTPLHRQLYDQLQKAIASKRLVAGTQLPSTRNLSAELGISRNTVQNAFEQLLAEGYLEGKVGSGTYVAEGLPEDLLNARFQGAHMPRHGPRPTNAGRRGLSQRGLAMVSTPLPVSRFHSMPKAFRPGIPALDAFPFEIWSKLTSQHLHRPIRYLLGYGEPAGYRPLREAIAAYVGAARAVRCSPDQVIMVTGSQQAVDLVARVLLDPGDEVWVEDPGYVGTRCVLVGAGARLVPVPVDKEGLSVSTGELRSPRARMACVAPSHQFPMGVTMSLSRRLELLDWADRAGAWIIEDDYDSEYRYMGRPIGSLQGLDDEGRVIYAGTFSKVMFPSLRLGYVVVPPDLVDAFTAARTLMERHGPSVEQSVLTEFITEGHFGRHIRRMRALYAERQEILVDAIRHDLKGLLEVEPAEGGLHLLGRLPQGVDDCAAATLASQHSVEVYPLSEQSIGPVSQAGLILGYPAYSAYEIREGVRRLGMALRSLPQHKRMASFTGVHWIRQDSAPYPLTAS